MPAAWGGEADNVTDIESCFAQELDDLMAGALSAHQAVCGWERACVHEATRLQSLAASYMHIPASADYYGRQAERMWEEACTWKLVRCLFCRCVVTWTRRLCVMLKP